MKPLTHCPKCHNQLVFRLIITLGSYAAWEKECSNHKGNKFLCRTSFINEILNDLHIYIDRDAILSTYAHWNFKNNILIINKVYNNGELFSLVVPFFDPQPYMNDFDKLIKKLKIYIILS
jgi:hypothetical protein